MRKKIEKYMTRLQGKPAMECGTDNGKQGAESRCDLTLGQSLPQSQEPDGVLCGLGTAGVCASPTQPQESLIHPGRMKHIRASKRDPASPPRSILPSPTSSKLHALFYFFLLTHKVTLYCLYMNGCGAIHWPVLSQPGVTQV